MSEESIINKASIITGVATPVTKKELFNTICKKLNKESWFLPSKILPHMLCGIHLGRDTRL